MNFNLKGSSRKSRVSYFTDSSKQVDSNRHTDVISHKDEDSLRYIQELKRALNAPINKSEQNLMESLKLLKDIENISNDNSTRPQASNKRSLQHNYLTLETQNSQNQEHSENESKTMNYEFDALKIVLNGKIVRDSTILNRFKRNNKPSAADELPNPDDFINTQINVQITEKSPTTKFKSLNIQNNTITEVNFARIAPLYVNIRGQLDHGTEDAQSSLPSIDEQSLSISMADKTREYPQTKINPFVNSDFNNDYAPSPTTKLRINRVDFLLDRKSSVSVSGYSVSNKDENIREALRLGIALNNHKNSANLNSFYQSNNCNQAVATIEQNEKPLLKGFNLGNNDSLNGETSLNNHQPSFRCIEKNPNFYKFKEELDNYQSNYDSTVNVPDWNDLKSLNLFNVPLESRNPQTGININIIKPEQAFVDDYTNSPMIYTEADFSVLKNGSRLFNQNTLSSMIWKQDHNIISEKDMFETKQLLINQREPTYQSLSSKDIELNDSNYHPFIESIDPCTSNNERSESSIQDMYSQNSRRTSMLNKYDKGFELLPKKSEKIEDFNYSEENWDSYISNRLNQMITQGDEKLKDFIETDQLFKKNTDHEYIEYPEPSNVNVIEVDNKDPTFISSNRFTEKCSIDGFIHDNKIHKAQGRDVISDNNTPNKLCKVETQYFSFNPTD